MISIHTYMHGKSKISNIIFIILYISKKTKLFQPVRTLLFIVTLTPKKKIPTASLETIHL